MCGIAGILNPAPSRPLDLARMLHALEHRGPDGEGTYHDDLVSLGHRRLSIIDLEGGKQPLCNQERTIWLVCNGEIYNYRELRQKLEAGGHRFLTHSDCEVIIGLYERYGDKLLDHLRGMFAFVLWDTRKRKLLAARDHLGQKPLYYRYEAGEFACASEIKALIAYENRAARMNLAALDQYLALRLIDAPLSMFEGIHKLPPGHLLTVSPDEPLQIRRYWTLQQAPKLAGTETQLLDELEARVEAALRLHLESDVPVGALLSGGMDSSLLVAMLCRKLNVKDLSTFTIGLNYQRFDEAPAARAVAQLFGTRHHEDRVSPDMIALLPDLITALDEPSDPLSLCTWLLAKFTRQHVKVVIGGDGGDELFGGYDRYYGNLYAAHYGKVPAALRRRVLAPAMSLIPESGWYKSVGHQLRWLHHLSFHNGGDRYAASLSYFYFDRERRHALLGPVARERWHTLDAEAAIRTPYEAAEGSDLDRMLYADSLVRMPNHPVMITDRICMAHGLEARSPFMDHELAQFAARLPDAMKVRGSTLRYIQRKLAERYLPPQILNRPKQGFSSALPYLLQTQYARLYETCLTQSRLVEDGILDSGAIKSLVTQHTSRRADHGNRLWLLINAELWYRLAIRGESKSDLSAELVAKKPPTRRAG
ncbi:MAG TPA: asparagine synthase (glutamine-hydrolyzing) [Steroidobacteraceae bacterium]|nr:asparagine synthase (glutamine-hydrolyzing) [Steroidobacteraceae bacterium]